MRDHLAVSGSSAAKPSYEELAALVVRLSGELDRANERIAELEARLGLNSGNSSKPPSSDGLAKPAPRSLRKGGQRKPGRPKGTPGATLAQVEHPDEWKRHEPERCRGCGDGLVGAPEAGMEKRQVFDIPPIKVRVTEHQLIERRCCGCGILTKGTAPVGVTALVQYGSGITAIIVYLYIGQFLSKDRTARALADLFGVPVTGGTVLSMTARAATRLDGFLARAAEQVAAAPVAHFDETGFRVEGRLHWVHSGLHRQVESDQRAP